MSNEHITTTFTADTRRMQRRLNRVANQAERLAAALEKINRCEIDIKVVTTSPHKWWQFFKR